MSRRITIKSDLIEEVALANEVIQKLNRHTLSYDEQEQCFINQQYDDIADTTIKEAENLYYEKRRIKNIEKVTEGLKKAGYTTTTKVENNKTKVIAVQRVYA